jgi:hypothetical protein
MKIRVYGQPGEVDQAVDELRTVFSVTSVSRHYADKDASQPGSVRVYVDATLRDEVLVVGPPPAEPTTLGAPKWKPATDVRPGDRLLVPRMGWHRVVRVFPQPEQRPDDLAGLFIWTRPNEQPYRWAFPPSELLRVTPLVAPGDFEEVPE